MSWSKWIVFDIGPGGFKPLKIGTLQECADYVVANRHGINLLWIRQAADWDTVL